MRDKQDTIWSKIKSRVLNYEPDDYSNNDWAEMERLLNANAAKQLWWKVLFTKRITIFLIVTLFTVGVWSLDLFEVISFSGDQVTTTNTTQILSKDLGTKKAIPNTLSADSKKQECTSKALSETNLNRNVKRKFADDLNITKEKLTLETLSSSTNREESMDSTEQTTAKNESDDSKTLPEQGELEKGMATSNALTDLNASQNMGSSMEELLPIQTLEFSMLTPSSITYSLSELNTSNPLTPRKWKFGFSVGLTTVITDYDRMSFSVLPHVGVFVSRALGERLELQLEGHFKTVINYNVSQTFEEEVFSSLGKIGEISVTNTYKGYTAIEIPLVIKYAANSKLGFLTGGRYSIIRGNTTAGSTATSGITYIGPPIYERIPQKGFWGNDFGLVLGIEVYLNSTLRFDLRYNQGFRDITPDNLYKDTKVHLNSDLQISLHRFF